MTKLDHLTIFVSDWQTSRDWYVDQLACKLEFEIQDRGVAAVQDDAGLTLFLQQSADATRGTSCRLYFQVDDVEAKFRELSAKGVQFVHPPQRLDWGYGAELRDPTGYVIGLWDEVSMREKGQSQP
jgi:predicted enzyme related to lactoylglutathione lyase